MNHVNWHNRPTIGVLAGWQFYRTATNLSYLKPIYTGIRAAAQHLGCNAFFGCGIGASASPGDPIRSAWPFSAPDVDYVPINSSNTDGLIILTPLHSSERSQYIQNLRAEGFPILFLGSGERGPTVSVDNSGGVFTAIEHLVQHGHRKIAFLAGSMDDMQGDTGERLRAYQAALTYYGLEGDPKSVIFGRHVFDGGYAGIKKMIKEGNSFTAVLASNDEMALGAIHALKEMGFRIPQDTAIIGFDNRPESSIQEPPLSSIHIPLFEIGYRAVELMMRHFEGKGTLSGTVRVQTRLVCRESCGCGSYLVNQSSNQTNITETVPDANNKQDRLIDIMATTVLNQAQNLSETQCRSICCQLIKSFDNSIEELDPTGFISSLNNALQSTVTSGDNAYIWQDAINLLKKSFQTTKISSSLQLFIDAFNQAHQMISSHMQRQHRQMIVDQQWISSRLSLLTASLQTALDEASIFEVLEQHLKDLNIKLALIVLFEAQDDDPFAWSNLCFGIQIKQDAMRFPSPAFPPAGIFNKDIPIQLTIIPLVNQIGQIGYLVFDSDNFDIYGFIVQQLGGAFNTARLYKQATEGRRLAEEANLMKSRFLSTISHELRTPVNLILGLSGIVMRQFEESDHPIPEKTRKDIERISAYSQHLGGLIGDVIDLATSDAGQLRLNFETVNLSQALIIIAESGRQLANDKGLEWEASIPKTGPWVWGDPTRLRQIVLNLINNAIKFTSEGYVRLLIKDHGDTVSITVSDTGLGISPDEQEAIFDEFWQSKRSIALGYGGLGLGLAISKRLVELHGGTISVQSTGKEGYGSVFSFTLPTVHRTKEEIIATSDIQPLRQHIAILTCQPGSSEHLRMELVQRGIGVETILINQDGEWKSQLRGVHPDAIILDISSDSSLGWETLKMIKTQKDISAIPVMLFSSSQSGGSMLELDYLTKPIEISELTRALDQQWLMAETGRPIRTILVVDDEPNTLEMNARIVQSQASTNTVLKARNGKEALEILRREIVDLVLLDLQMPEMDGFELLEIMRGMESLRKIPVIVVTGKSLTEEDMKRLNQGITAVLSKGIFSFDETVTHIRNALQNKRKISGEAQRLVRLAIAYLHEHFTEPLSRREVAQHIGITEDHLTFCFRQELGTTPIVYLHRLRINEAKRLLKNTQLTITEIALNIGFSDSGYFSRVFRREVGMAPETFRRT